MYSKVWYDTAFWQFCLYLQSEPGEVYYLKYLVVEVVLQWLLFEASWSSVGCALLVVLSGLILHPQQPSQKDGDLAAVEKTHNLSYYKIANFNSTKRYWTIDCWLTYLSKLCYHLITNWYLGKFYGLILHWSYKGSYYNEKGWKKKM